MRFLRMFTNSLLAGGLGAAYLTVLVLQLNPDLPLLSTTALRWYLVLAATYGLNLALVFYALLMLRDFLSMTALSPGWASVRVLAWLSAGCAALAAVVMWLNVDAFRATLGEVAARRMVAGGVASAVSAVVLIGLAFVHYSYGRRGGRVGGALFAIAAFGSLALPLAARGPAVTRPSLPALPHDYGAAGDGAVSPRIFMLLLDGASLEYVRTKAAEGRLPHFARVLDGGASMYLSTLRPTHPAPVWTAVATGMYPAKNGVRSAARYYAWGGGRPATLLPTYCFAHLLVRLGVIREEPHTSAAWQTRPLWSILSNVGIASGMVRWPLTYPARPVLGYTITDRADPSARAAGAPVGRAVYPATLLEHVRVAFDGGEEREERAADGPVAAAERLDRLYSRAAHALYDALQPQVAAVRFAAIDTAGHRYHGDTSGTAFRANGGEEGRSNAQRMERVYGQVDGEVGAALDRLAPGDLMLVVSAFGMERLHPLEGLLARFVGDAVQRGGHEAAPDGFLLAYGTAVQPGRLPPGSIVDVTPTVLYFLGVPIGRDMDGFARTDLFTPEFTADRPIAFIGTHNH